MNGIRHIVYADISDRNFDVAVKDIYRWADGPNYGDLAFLRVTIMTAAVSYSELVAATDYSIQNILRRHPDLWVSRKGRDAFAKRMADLVTDRLQRSVAGWAFSQTGLHQLEDRTVFVAGDRLIGGEDLDFVVAPSAAQFHLKELASPPGKVSE